MIFFSMATSNLHPRVVKVTHEDFDKVMSIIPPSEIYGGRDYLPDYFHLLLNQSHNTAFAVVIGEQFVAFGILSKVDGGITVVGRAGRVHKDFIGKGLTKLIDPAFYEIHRGKKVIYRAATANVKNTAVQKRIAAGIEKLLMKQFWTIFESDVKSVQRCLDNLAKPSKRAHSLNSTELGHLLDDKTLSKVLFPEGKVIVDWVPYRPMKSNADLMMTERTMAVFSRMDSPLLTIGNSYIAPAGFIYNMDIFGNVCNIQEHFYRHLAFAIERAKISKCDKIYFRCIMSEKFKNNFDDVTGIFGLRKTEITGSLYCTEYMADGSEYIPYKSML